MSIQSILKYPPSSFTNLKSQSLQVIDDIQCTPITTANRDADITGADGMIVFNEDENEFQGYYSGSWNALSPQGPTGPTGPSIFTTATGSLSSSNIDNLHSTPITLVAAQGTGTVIVPIFTSLQFVPGVTPYVGATGFNPIIYRGETGAATEIGNYDWAATPSVLAGVSGIYQCLNNETISSSDTYVLTSAVDNQPILIRDDGAAPFPSGGNGTIKWKVTYCVQSLS